MEGAWADRLDERSDPLPSLRVIIFRPRAQASARRPLNDQPRRMPNSVAPPAPHQVDSIRQRADALYRTAAECCHQHERLARLMHKSPTAVEQRISAQVVRLCDDALAQITADYERCAARACLEGDDAAWWHKANTLWQSAREYARRHRLSDLVSNGSSGAHPAVMLGEMQVDYELEASALLALQQAMAAYRKVRASAE